MRNYNLEQNDIYQIAALINNNTNIYKLYLKLYTLEIEDKKNSEEYIKHLNYLSIFTEVEDKIYKESGLTFESTLSWIKFLLNYKKIESLDLKETIVKQENDINTLAVYRILNILITRLTKYYNIINRLSSKEIDNIMKMLKIVNSNNKYNSIFLNRDIEKDVFYSFLTFLQEYVNDPKYNNFKKKLLTAKYNCIFLNKDIENYEINKNFDIPSLIYINSKITSDLLKINLDTYKQIKNSYAHRTIDTNIYELLEINDIDYNDINKALYSILRQCMMKSTFLLMSDESINDVNYDFHEYIENDEYKDFHPYNDISANLIISCFKGIKKNKSKMRILSLKK